MISTNKSGQTPNHFETSVILIGGSSVNWNYLKQLKKRPIIAVDGGANDLREHNLKPELICGDFDSLSKDARSHWQSENTQFLPLPDQNHSDLAKALSAISAPKIIAFGFLGNRLDHSLSALSQIAKYPAETIYLIGQTEIACVIAPSQAMTIKRNQRISFWSAGHSRIQISQGLKWPLNNLEISAAHMSISNQTEESEILIDYQGDPLIALMEINAINIDA